MRSTMQTLTNISYDGRTIDLSEEGDMTCVCNCDCLSHIAVDVYDMDGKLSPRYTSLGNGYEPLAERGEKLTISMSSRALGNGYDQMCIMTIYQARPNMTEDETSPGRYDVYMGSGRIQANSETSTEVNIGKGITYIRPARYDVSTPTRLIGGCVIVMSNTMMMIQSYDADTGIANVLSSSKINGTTYNARTTAQGEKFKLLTNYLTCDAFDFYTRPAPSVSLSYSIDKEGLHVSGTYLQSNGVGLQSYKLKVEYHSDIDNDGTYQIMTFVGEKKYSQVIEDTFPVLGRLYNISALDYNGMRISCEITTQENYTKTYTLGVKANTYNTAHPIVNLDWEYTAGIITDRSEKDISGIKTISIYSMERTRQDLSTLYSTPHYCGNTEYNTYTETARLTRITEGHGRYYRYILYASDDDGKIYYSGVTDNGFLDFGNDRSYWSLRKLVLDGSHKYRQGNEIQLTYDLQPSVIETCINSMVYNAEGPKPKYVHGNDNYDKGSFTVILSNEDNTEITINNDIVARYTDIKEWLDFISAGGPFLLKTDKGDVKIVEITSNPVRSYGAGIADIGIVRVTVGWTEVDDIEKAVFV